MLVFRFDEPYLNGNKPTQGLRKTLTRVGIEPTTFGLDHIRREQVMGIEDVKFTAMNMYKYKGLRLSKRWPCSTYISTGLTMRR